MRTPVSHKTLNTIKMRKLLIVDDDAQTRRLLSATFGYDYEILQASDGVHALKIVLEAQPDVVILDGRMPGLDGLAVLGAIKADPELAGILVVMLTGRGQFSDLERGVELGADAYFIKPVSPAILKKWVWDNLKPDESETLALPVES